MMKIDRSVFFLLTATIAGAACASDPGATPKTVAETKQKPPETIEMPTLDAPTASSTPAPPAATAKAPPPPPPPPPPPAMKKKARLAEDEMCKPTTKKFDPNRKGCDDQGQVAMNCGAVSSYPASETCGGPNPIREKCEAYKKTMKPKVAMATWTCQLRNNGKPNCETCPTSMCAYEALMGACPDAGARADCEGLAEKCDGVDVNKCTGMLSGLTVKARKYALACVGDCSTSLLHCVVDYPADE
jgi:hypothetical protein